MTIEEAIKVIENERDCLINGIQSQCIVKRTQNQCDRKCYSCDLFLCYEETLPSYEMAISALRAQQEAEKDEPCYFCKRYNFANARVEVNKYGAYISLAGGNTQFPRNEQFNFCPVCGRVLKHRPPVKEET